MVHLGSKDAAIIHNHFNAVNPGVNDTRIIDDNYIELLTQHISSSINSKNKKYPYQKLYNKKHLLTLSSVRHITSFLTVDKIVRSTSKKNKDEQAITIAEETEQQEKINADIAARDLLIQQQNNEVLTTIRSFIDITFVPFIEKFNIRCITEVKDKAESELLSKTAADYMEQLEPSYTKAEYRKLSIELFTLRNQIATLNVPQLWANAILNPSNKKPKAQIAKW